jgi:hypothetical protein
LYQAKCRRYAAYRFSHFLLKAFVKRVSRRMCILIVRFWRSTLEPLKLRVVSTGVMVAGVWMFIEIGVPNQA